MKQKIIAFSGAHGTGKTTAVNHLVKFLRENTAPEVKIGAIMETARQCPFQVYSAKCSHPSESAQEWIFASQLLAEIEAFATYDIVVSDRSTFDCIAYTRHFGYYVLANAMENMAMLGFQRYRQIVFHKVNAHNYLVDDGFRAMDVTARHLIERTLSETYRRQGISTVESASYVTIPTNLLSQDLQAAFKPDIPWEFKRDLSLRTIMEKLQVARPCGSWNS